LGRKKRHLNRLGSEHPRLPIKGVEMSQRPNRSTTTGGSDEREARALSGPLLRFALSEEAARLRAETSFLDSDRNARTLTKAGAFRLVLVVFRAGATFDENDQRGSVALQVLDGRVDVQVAEDAMEIVAGEIAVVSPEHPWKAIAVTDGLLLLHLAWPPEPLSR
jgi:quercetin dioxygenase-like cupin family protein